eukprot:c30459_g1_i1.p1 GENE.c30459_g1_i1~~c30459_g1_i1.p1  ORF type:complete len:583 (+),score=208.00 c30459_g1_i1:32-1750(+)
MNVSQAIRDYIFRMINDVSGMKVMLFDKETTGIVSMVLSQSDILTKDVFLTELLSPSTKEQREKSSKMPHLKAVVFIRPTSENIQLLRNEIKEPHYGEYHIFFSNIVKSSFIEELARADENEVIRQVQEYYADFFAVNSSLFSLNLNSLAPLSMKDIKSDDADRIVDGLGAIVLALKKKPIIRYQKNSSTAENVAKLFAGRMEREKELFHQSRKTDTPPLLLILDRRDDPVTPLLTQWTYQAMVHEFLGIYNHRVSLKNAPDVKADMQEIVLNPNQDDFFSNNFLTNFGDLGINIKELVDQYQSKHQSHQNIESIADMQRFVENYPEFRKLSGNVSKHVTVMGELSRLIEVGKLMECSELEQELACGDNHGESVRLMQSLLSDQSVSIQNKLRLVMLYALRYEDKGENNLPTFLEQLRSSGADASQIRSVNDLVEYAGAKNRSSDLYASKNFFTSLKKTVQRELQGVSNVYTQHKPYLDAIIDQLSKNKLREQVYPTIGGAIGQAAGQQQNNRPQEIIIFYVGGTTYEEALTVELFNKSSAGMKIVLGGTTIHNSKSFLSGIKPALGVTDLT